MNRRVVIWAVVAVVAAGLGAAGALFWPKAAPTPPDATKQSPQDAARYMASAEFEKVDDAKKEAYFAELVKKYEKDPSWIVTMPDLTEAERERLRKNAGPLFRKEMLRRVDGYFALPEEKRTAYLDGMIDQMQAMRKAMEEYRKAHPESAARRFGGGPGAGTTAAARSGGSGETGPALGPPDGPGGRLTPQRMRDMIETTPPEQRARFAEFARAMMTRMMIRGLGFPGRAGEPPGPPPK